MSIDITINKLKDLIPLEKIIGKYTKLTRKNGVLWGACPIHKEKTPSFIVNEYKNFFYCFGCLQGGDVITFIQKIENLSFRDSIDFLSNKFNIKINKNRSYAQEICKKYIELANKQLLKNERIIDYLNKRDISLDVMEFFQLGFDNGSLISQLLKIYSIDKLYDLGFVTQNSWESKYSNRLIIPIKNSIGNIVSFSSRVINDTNIPKYLHMQGNGIFHKSCVLFNLYNVLNEPTVYVVEGFFDVFRMGSMGYKNTIGLMGCAITNEQSHILSRYFKKIVLIFDGDDSGFRGLIKSVLMLLNIIDKTIISIIKLPFNTDPDDFLQKNKNILLKELEINIEEFLWLYYVKMPISSVHSQVLMDKKIEEINNIINNKNIKFFINNYLTNKLQVYSSDKKFLTYTINKKIEFINREFFLCAIILFNIEKFKLIIHDIINIFEEYNFINQYTKEFQNIIVKNFYSSLSINDQMEYLNLYAPIPIRNYINDKDIQFIINNDKRLLKNIIEEEMQN